ncbi:hypothetical protein JVT61DRAFT_3988 [Boletus reticuloceps]|uniref:Uncharacterized protein n=1 Tax=Boletus reticuloceps TaxID=495285 RepID=A0A8I2YMN1_9AGAM|nr:hypothetical protein JVT61DRAFT_3988 [Boletus reticuloceps]
MVNAIFATGIAKISMIGIWVETVLYGESYVIFAAHFALILAGINCVMFGLCIFVFFGRKMATLRWPLMVMTTILFLLSTVHIGASLRQLLEAFIYAPVDVPDYTTLYWYDFAATPRLLKDIVYVTLVLAQDIILIWRLYVVFAHNWKVIILPIILLAGCIGSAYAASIISTSSNRGLPVSSYLLVSAWAFGFTTNVSVTLAIAGRLWRMGRKFDSLTGTRTNRFASSIYLVVESGAISAVSSTVVLALYANPAALTGLDISAQVIALASFLIVVQLGVIGQHIPRGNSSRTVRTAQSSIAFRVGAPQEQDDSPKDIPLHITQYHSEPRSSHDLHV